MLLNSKDVKRLVIYFIYDKQGIVDDYIIYMLNALKKESSEIAVVVNGKLTSESREKLLEITPVVMARDNKGLDVWAYKTMIDYYGWERLCQFDEVVLMNFTIMGPVYPLNEMFSSMDKRDLDFWGVTMYHKYEAGDPYGTIEVGYIPDHIQSHFIAVRNSMLKSLEFQYYWDNMGEIKDYRDAVGCHEAMFTKRFEEKGFKWDVYADMGEGYNNHPILCATKEMLEQKRCPFFKRRSFMQDYTNIITDTIGQSAIEAYQYIKDKTDYNVDLIWQNILRLENQADIKRNMQLNYILPTNEAADLSEEQKNKKVALVLHSYFEDLIDYCVYYAKSMPDNADIYVTVGDEKKIELIKEKFSVLPNKVEVIKIQNRGRDVSALLVATKEFIMDYDYVCFMHDKKVTQLKPETIGYGFSYKCFENLLPSKAFVTQVIKTFEENPRLGLLTPPPPNHGDYFITLGMEWGMNYDITLELAKKLKLTVPISRDKEPIAPLGTMFWFRPCAMKLLFDCDWEYEDFPKEPNNIDGTLLHAVERIYSYVIQQEGYYPAWIFSDKCASIEITNLNYMIRTENKIIFEKGSGAGNFDTTCNLLKDAFGQWRTTNQHIGNGDNIFYSRLYLGKNGVFSEENSYLAYNTSYADECYFAFDSFKDANGITEIRWDPGEEAGTTIYNVSVDIELSTKEHIKYNLDDFATNGMKIENRIVFIGPDPMIVRKLDREGSIKKIIIRSKAISTISASDANYIVSKTNNIVDKILNLFRRIKSKLVK